MVLVTGASGLLGMEVCRQLLHEGKQVRAIYNKNHPGTFPAGLEAVQCSILDTGMLEDVMQGINEVYHCAGLVSFEKGNNAFLYKINVEGTANVVNAALSAGVKKLVHVSSVAALGRMRTGKVNEEMQWTEETSNSNYGKSKYLAEMEVWRGVAEGLDAAIVNPSIILGAGDWNAGSTKIFNSVYNEFPWYSEGTTGFVDVRDVASAMIILMNSDVSGQRFIISGENSSYRELFSMISSCFKKKEAHKKVTPFIASLVWRIEAIRSKFTDKQPLITKETARTALAKVEYDNSKFLNQFPGFTFTPLQETVAYTCSALQQKLNTI